MACVGYHNVELEQFVHNYYAKDTWERVYALYIHPVRRENQWDKTSHEDILPLHYSRGGGRPKKKRTKSNDVPPNPYKAKRTYRQMECGKCGEKGHNARACKGTTFKDKHAKKKKIDSIVAPLSASIPASIPSSISFASSAALTDPGVTSTASALKF